MSRSLPAVVAKATSRMSKLYNKQVSLSKLYGVQVASLLAKDY